MNKNDILNGLKSNFNAIISVTFMDNDFKSLVDYVDTMRKIEFLKIEEFKEIALRYIMDNSHRVSSSTLNKMLEDIEMIFKDKG